MNRLGGAYINFEKNFAVGVDGLKIVAFQRRGRTIRVKLENQLAALASPYAEPFAVELRMVGLSPGEYTLHLNDQPPRRVDAAELAHYSFIETPMLKLRPK
jgi:hypothetical protein